MRPHEGNGESLQAKVDKIPHISPVYSYGQSFYPISKEWYTALTMCLKGGMPTSPYLIEWFKKNGLMADQIRDEKASRGLRIDKATERIDAGETLNLRDWPPDEIKAIVSYIHFLEDHDVKVLGVQKTVWDTRNKIAGTMDKAVELDGDFGPLDVKFTNGLYESMQVQVQSYAYMMEQVTGIKSKMTALLRLGSKHKRGYELKVEEYDPQYFEEVTVPAKKLFMFMNGFPDGPKPQEVLPDSVSKPGKEPQPIPVPSGNGRSVGRW